MCGIAGIIYRDGTRDVGRDMTRMLQSMKHRGPDSTGYALYGQPHDGQVVMRYTLADANTPRDFEFDDRIQRHQTQVVTRLKAAGAQIDDVEPETEYAYRTTLKYDGDLKDLTDRIEDIPDAEVLSIGRSLEIVKDLGDAETVSDQYGLSGFEGTHAIGHVRMATESDVDISGAHPYWAYPFNDIAVVHNGQLTNYFQMRREFERRGHRFMSNCDSELLAVYTAYNLEHGATLEDSLKQSIREIDGVFTYLVSTRNELGMAKDTMAAKPMVLYESDNLVALASEEVAIRAVVPREIDTWDPYDEEVRVWRA